MKKIIEVVSFTIKSNTTEEALLLASANFETMLKREIKGFSKRVLSKHTDKEQWIEMIWWDSMEDAQNALETAPSTQEFEEYNALLEEDGCEIYYLKEK